ncbi:MAG TPA: glycosyltransferase family 9 protein [Anaerohalosphaeraceae bacterium]|nr:glycosyltransferase family 9 protein [Anaerohalosphaeraceae bacterium]HPO69816.1 glycosyltransferase family 9 protein [Anaerohalosphaeraceae bacterium]
MNRADYHNILIIKPSALGDIVHALPVLSSLRASFPKSRLSWLVRKEFAPLLECAEGLDNIITFDRKEMGRWYRNRRALMSLLELRNQLRAARFDLVLDLQGLLRSAIFAWMTGCPDRIGMREAREGAHLFHTRIIDRPAGTVHLLDYYHSILQAIGASVRLTECPLTVPPAAENSILQKMQLYGLRPKQFLVLIASSAHASKCWPPQHFAAAAESLHKRFGWDTAAVGTAGDKTAIEAIQSCCRIPVANLAGQTSIPELIALFRHSAAVISNDTGPGHIALAVKSPAVLVFGPTNPLRLGPYRRPECIAAIDPDKRGCAVKSSNPAYRIEHVPAEMVIEKILEQIPAVQRL